MKHSLLSIILFVICSFNALAQDTTAIKTPVATSGSRLATPVKLNRSAEALGISPQVEARLQKLNHKNLSL